MNNNDNLRDRNLLRLFLVLNVGLAGAFVAYLFLSRNNQPAVVPAHFSTQAKAPAQPAAPTNARRSDAPKASAPETSSPSAVSGLPSSANGRTVSATIADAPPQGNASRFPVASSAKRFSWEDVESADYPAYLERLRAAGCPEDKIRAIVSGDINALFDQRRLKEAIARDIQWWRPRSDYYVSNALQEKGRQLEEQRRNLLRRLLGAEAPELETDQPDPALWSNVQLTGPVLGALSLEKHARVQELCGKALDRQQSAVWAGVHDSQPVNNVEMARLREQTRADLRQVLNPLELEEFLLRYSHVAHYLRQELISFDASPEEFRKIFRAVDALDHPMQLEFGGVETMSAQQRARYERQRETAIREALGPERYQAYLLTKDPLYRQAQMFASQQNAPPQALMPIYQLTKATEAKRQQILNDASLTPEQRNQALHAVQTEQVKSIQKIVSETAAPR